MIHSKSMHPRDHFGFTGVFHFNIPLKTFNSSTIWFNKTIPKSTTIDFLYKSVIMLTMLFHIVSSKLKSKSKYYAQIQIENTY